MADFIKIDSGDIEDALAEILETLEVVKGGYVKSLRRALIRTSKGVRTDAVRRVRDQFQVKASEIRNKTKIKKQLTGNSPAILIDISDRASVPLVNYNVRPRTPAVSGGRLPKKGVSVQVKKTSGRKVIDESFIAKMKSGHIGVFKRSSDESLPIRELYSVSSIHELMDDDTQQHLREQAEERLVKNVISEADYILQQAGLK